jgi:cell division protein FtsL
MAGALVGTGLILFLHVWCPIQAERAAIKLKKIESEIAQKKSELNELNETAADLTSLSALDRWARAHGPWRVPSDKDIIAING